VERSDTHRALDDGDGFREGLNPSDLLPDAPFGLFGGPRSIFLIFRIFFVERREIA
jgi:hypothetical protein